MILNKKVNLCRAALCVTGLALLLELGGCGFAASRELNIVNEKVAIPGYSGEMDILFITDPHAVVKDPSASQQEIAYSAERYGLFQDKEGMAAEKMLQDLFSYANSEEVDAVFLGGDVIDHPSKANLKYLDEELGSLKMPYLYALGNHDWTYPWDYMTDSGKEEYLPLLEPYMGGNTVIHAWETDGPRIIAVDNSSNQINPQALGVYAKLLKTDKPVILLLHVPFASESLSAKAEKVWSAPVAIGGGSGDIVPNDVTEQFQKLTFAPDSPVVLILAGHVHFYDKSFVGDRVQILQIVGDAAYNGSAIRLHIVGADE